MNSLLDNLTPLILKHSKNSLTKEINWLMLSNGAADLNDNVIFFGFEAFNPEPSFVAKIPRLPSNAWIVQVEYAHLTEVWEHLSPDSAKFIPEPIALFQAGEQQVLVISYVRGEGLLYSAKQQFRQKPEYVRVLSQEVARSLRRLHDKISTPLEENEQVASDFLDKVTTFKEYFELTIHEQRVLSRLTDLYISQTAEYKTVIQGDFWHGNIIRSATQDDIILVDWQYSRWSTDVSLDVYLFLLAGALALSTGTDVERAKATMEVLYQWKPDILPAYLIAYGTTDHYSLLPTRYGMMLCCMEKAVRAILDFGYNQSDGLIWRNLFAEIADPRNDGFFDET